MLIALDHAGIGMVVTTATERGVEYLYWNRALTDILGIDDGDLGRYPPMSMLAPEEIPRLEQVRDQVARGEVPNHIELIALRPDGQRAVIELGLASTTYQGRPVRVGFCRDITERRRSEEELRKSERRFRQLAETTPDSISVVSHDGQFVYANPATAAIFGFDSVEAFLARPLTQLIEPAEVPELLDKQRRVLTGERLPPSEFTAFRGDGQQMRIEVSCIGTEWEGRPASIGIARDVSERRRMQAELVQAERMAAVGTLAAGVAHEINNPLTYVLLRLQSLRHSLPQLIADPVQREQVRAQLEDVIDGNDRVAEIVRDLLSFARSDTNDAGPTELEPVLESVVKLATTTARHRSAVECDFGAVGLVRGNRARLGQVFLNLVINATQAFEADDPERNRIAIATRRRGSEVEVEIADNGCGVSPAHAERIFQPFFTTKAGQGGTGLGLAITRSIVDSLGGRIAYAPRPGGGSRFLVTLNAAEPIAPAASRPAPPVTSSSRRARVLVIDDEQLICRALAAILEEWHEVATETSSPRALERLLREPLYDVVFCDLSMPDLMGQDLFARVCEAQPKYAARFVFITGGATSSRAARFLSSTGAPIIAKPFAPDDICRAVSMVQAATG